MIIYLVMFSCVLFILSDHISSAEGASVSFNFHSTNPGVTPIITVLDNSADTTDGHDSVNVTISSNGNPLGIPLQLVETGDHTGEFMNTALVLMDGENLIPQSSTISIFFDDPSRDTDTVTVSIHSFFPPDFGALAERGIIDPFILTRTSPGHYEGTLTLTPAGPTTETQLEAADGDVIEVRFPCDIVDGLVTPNPDPTVGAIQLAHGPGGEISDVLTATYDNGNEIQSDNADVANAESCGGSSGGIAVSRIVLDVLGGTSGGDFLAPQLIITKLDLSNLPIVGDLLNSITNADPFTPIASLDDSAIDYPISINGNGYLLTQYSNTIQTYTGKTGEPVSFKMTLFDATGVEHIGFYTNLRGDHREVSDSDTYLIYNEEKPLELTDPHGFLSLVNFTESEKNGKYIANFNMTFAKPMDTSDIIIRTWDERLNSGDIKVFDAIKIEGEPLVNPDTNNLIVPDSSSVDLPYYKMPYYEIPKADSDGNLVYHNSFGGLEEKQVHPQSTSVIYPDYLGKSERHDDGFYDSVSREDVKVQTIAQSLTGNPFSFSEDNKKEFKFYYPSNVGKLDRENKDSLKDLLSKENMKAYKISKKYLTHHVID